jgi:Ca-activated chloride channel homolog
MHLNNSTSRAWLAFLLAAVFSCSLWVAAQTSSSSSGQNSPSANGPVRDVIPPLPDAQQPGNGNTQQQPGNAPQQQSGSQQPVAQQPANQQPANQPSAAPQNGPVQDVIPPLPDTQQPKAAGGNQPQPAPAQPAPAQPAQGPPNQPGNTVRVPAASQEPSRQDNGVFVFKKQVEEVVLHATVVDDRQRLVTNLDKTAFTVYEDGQPQNITNFRHEDIPVAIGIVIDNSGSMREKRHEVNQAAINLVKASNPNDEVFVVNFNDEYYLDQDFTSAVPKMQEALERIESRGGTALYDAVVASADHLKKSARLDKKVLLVVTDGEDNASRESLEQAIRRLQAENGPTVYTVGLLWGEGHLKRARRALQEMSEDTGGVSFFPKDLSEVDNITRQIAHDIRNQYTLAYKPTKPQTEGGYRTVKVEARAKGYGRLQVRTRSGYYAGQERASR